MIILYILISLFVAWIWVDYFRLIDIFEKNNLLYVLLVFGLGVCSVGIVLLFQNKVLYPTGWSLNGHFFNDFSYSVFGIGLVEEIAKISPFLLFHGLFRNKLREPIDYLAFVCLSALGFSAAENVLYYYQHGAHLIVDRSILCSISHMFDTAIVGYGFILLRFHPKFKNPLLIFGFLLLAALAHGIYDFWLLYDKIQYGYLITLLFYFVTLSVFATIINNSLNNSSHFTYKKAINADVLVKRMFFYYGVVFLLQFFLILFTKGIYPAFLNLFSSVIFSGLIVSVSILRLSRFQLIEGRWNKIKLELPFYLRGSKNENMDGFRPFGLRIKGPSHNEAYLASLYEEFVHLIPVRKSGISVPQLAFIEKKIFIREDEIYYILRLYTQDQHGSFTHILIKPKAGNFSHTKNNHPIVAKMELIDAFQPTQPFDRKKKYRFVEWVYLRKV